MHAYRGGKNKTQTLLHIKSWAIKMNASNFSKKKKRFMIVAMCSF